MLTAEVSHQFSSSPGHPPGTEMIHEMSKTSSIEIEKRELNPIKWERLGEGGIGKLELLTYLIKCTNCYDLH